MINDKHIQALVITLRKHSDLLLIILVGLVLRISTVGWFHQLGYTSDEREYILLATKLVAGEQYIDSSGDRSTRAPLFPYTLAVLFKLRGNNLVLSHVFGCVLGTVVILLGFLLSIQIFGDRTSALIAAAILCLYPSLVLYSGLLQTETLYIVFVLLTLLLFHRLQQTLTLTASIFFGVVSGLASLTRAVYVGFFPLSLFMLGWIHRKKFLFASARLATTFIVYSLVLAPWTLRNYEIHHKLIPVSAGGGNSLLGANNPFATGTWRVEAGFDQWFSEQSRKLGVTDVASLSESERSSISTKIALNYIITEPAKTMRFAAKKAYIFWVFPITNSDSYLPTQFIAVIFDIVLYTLLGIGLVVSWKRRNQLLPIYTAILFFFLVQIVLHSEARFRLPLVPMFALIAGNAGSLLLQSKLIKELNTASNKQVVIGLLILVFLIYAYTAYLFLTGIL